MRVHLDHTLLMLLKLREIITEFLKQLLLNYPYYETCKALLIPSTRAVFAQAISMGRMPDRYSEVSMAVPPPEVRGSPPPGPSFMKEVALPMLRSSDVRPSLPLPGLRGPHLCQQVHVEQLHSFYVHPFMESEQQVQKHFNWWRDGRFGAEIHGTDV